LVFPFISFHPSVFLPFCLFSLFYVSLPFHLFLGVYILSYFSFLCFTISYCSEDYPRL
jgi:hypothetical protein